MSAIIWLDILGNSQVKIMIGLLMMVFILGLCDDLVHVKPSIKIFGQVFVAVLAFSLLDIKIISFYTLFPNHTFPFFVSLLVTVLVIVVLTNAFNLIDGIDGLAGTVASITLLIFGLWYFLVGETIYSILSFAMLGGVIAFLVFNWEPSRIFMGDTGALTIGTMLSLLTIHFINANGRLPDQHVFKMTNPIAGAVAMMAIPVFDTIRIIIIRVSKGISPLQADKRHIHHGLVRIGLSHRRAVYVLLAVQMLFLTLGLLGQQWNEFLLLIAMIVLGVILSIILDRQIMKKARQ